MCNFRVDVRSLSRDTPSAMSSKTQDTGATRLFLFLMNITTTHSSTSTPPALGSRERPRASGTLGLQDAHLLGDVPHGFGAASLFRKRTPTDALLDEYGEMSGIVALERRDESLRGKVGHERRYMSAVRGRTRVKDLDAFTDMEAGESVTVAGLIMDHLDRIPKIGEEVKCAGVNLMISKATDRSIDEVLLFALEVIEGALDMILMLMVGVSLSLILSAFFSGTESGIYFVSKEKLRVLEAQGNRKAKRLLFMLASPGALVSPCWWATISPFRSAPIAPCATSPRRWDHPWITAEIMTTALFLPFFLFGEVLPKATYRLYGQEMMLGSVRIIQCFRWLFWPISATVGWVARRLEAAWGLNPETEASFDRDHMSKNIGLAHAGERSPTNSWNPSPRPCPPAISPWDA